MESTESSTNERGAVATFSMHRPTGAYCLAVNPLL